MPQFVTSFREKHDPSYAKWGTHINIIHPFARPEDFAATAAKINLSAIKPFSVVFPNFAHFGTSKDFVLFLEPKDGKEELAGVYREVCKSLQLDPTSVRLLRFRGLLWNALSISMRLLAFLVALSSGSPGSPVLPSLDNGSV